MLSICILNYNGKDYLEECLSSIPSAIQAERLLIDNASTDESWKIAEKYGFLVIHADNKYQFLTGINTALKEATGNDILFSQGDVRFSEGCIQSLIKALPFRKRMAIVQPIFLKDGEIDNAGMYWQWPGYGLGITRPFAPLGPDHEICTSITFLITREALDAVGLYDEAFAPAYMEDVDWAIRSKRIGVEHLVCYEAIVHHRHNESFSKVYSKKAISDICRKNRRYLIQKHYRGIDKWSRLAVASCLDVVKKSFDVITDRWISSNDRH